MFVFLAVHVSEHPDYDVLLKKGEDATRLLMDDLWRQLAENLVSCHNSSPKSTHLCRCFSLPDGDLTLMDPMPLAVRELATSACPTRSPPTSRPVLPSRLSGRFSLNSIG